MPDRVARRDDSVTPAQRAARRQQMRELAREIESWLLAMRIADALAHTGERLTLADLDRLSL